MPDPGLLDALRLNLVSGVGPRTWQLLLAAFETPQRVFAASSAELQQVQGVGPKLAAAILAARSSSAADEELALCDRLGVRLIPRGSADYPATLSETPDPPGILYARGTYEPRDQLALAIVGSRQCTAYGRQTAERFASALSRAGLTIVSGLARGIDAAAHRGALSAGGRTIAVLGTGLNNIYPPEHAGLAEDVVAHGVLYSEVALGAPAMPGMFPQRNRMISGLSLAVLIVEAGRSSGALHTARHATEQGREVLVIPDRIDSTASLGCLDLLRDGATVIRSPDDVLTALGPLMNPVSLVPPSAASRSERGLFQDPAPSSTGSAQVVHHPQELLLDSQQRQILNLLTTAPVHIDEVLRAAGLEPSRTLATLTMLEMKRLIVRGPGGTVARV